jgi:hypothetical protein
MTFFYWYGERSRNTGDNPVSHLFPVQIRGRKLMCQVILSWIQVVILYLFSPGCELELLQTFPIK